MSEEQIKAGLLLVMVKLDAIDNWNLCMRIKVWHHSLSIKDT